MKHLKSTFVALLALTAAASDAFAQGHRVPRRVARRWVARQWEARQWEACRRWVAAYRVCRAVAHRVSQVARWPVAYRVRRAVAHRVSQVARWPVAYRVRRAVAHRVSQVARWAAYRVSRAVDPSAMSRQAPRGMPSGTSWQAPREMPPGMSPHAAPREMSPAPVITMAATPSITMVAETMARDMVADPMVADPMVRDTMVTAVTGAHMPPAPLREPR
jgi:hypothetical protein